MRSHPGLCGSSSGVGGHLALWPATRQVDCIRVRRKPEMWSAWSAWRLYVDHRAIGTFGPPRF
jgi:hypothetical protein